MWQRLDRALINVEWGQRFASTQVEHAAKGSSDHCPLILWLTEVAELGRQSHFNFQDMWITHVGFL